MKKIVKISVVVLFLLAAFIGVQQGLKYYLKGPARYFNAIIIMGEKENVESAKTELQSVAKPAKDYPYKCIVNRREALDENGDPLVENGIQLYNETTFLVFSKSVASQMLEAQLFRVKEDGDALSGNIATVPMTEIRGLDSDNDVYLKSPNAVSGMEVDGTVLPLSYANYAWIGYYPEPAVIAIIDDVAYNSIQREEMQVSLMGMEGRSGDLRDASRTRDIESKITDKDTVIIDYTYLE